MINEVTVAKLIIEDERKGRVRDNSLILEDPLGGSISWERKNKLGVEEGIKSSISSTQRL